MEQETKGLLGYYFTLELESQAKVMLSRDWDRKTMESVLTLILNSLH